MSYKEFKEAHPEANYEDYLEYITIFYDTCKRMTN